jgi:hypothetical protein
MNKLWTVFYILGWVFSERKEADQTILIANQAMQRKEVGIKRLHLLEQEEQNQKS